MTQEKLNLSQRSHEDSLHFFLIKMIYSQTVLLKSSNYIFVAQRILEIDGNWVWARQGKVWTGMQDVAAVSGLGQLKGCCA